MVDIAKALHVDPGYPTKFFGIELGAQSKYNESTERAIVNGNHDQPDLAKLLEKFIDIFVLCPACRLPEIKMVVKKTVKIDCAACGHNGVLKTAHKLLTYIVNHAEDKKAKKEKEEGTKKGEKGEKKAEKKGKSDKPEKSEKDAKEKDKGEDEGDSDDEDAKPKKKKGEDEEEVQWFTDTSKAAIKARKEQEFAEMKANEVLKNAEKMTTESSADKSPVQVLKSFIAAGKRSPDEIQDELKRLQLARGMTEPQKVSALLAAIIDTTDVKNIGKQYTNNAALLKLFAPNRLTAATLLNCIEEQVGLVERKLLPRTAIILQALYEANILDEDAIVAWYTSPPESAWLVNKDVAAAVRAKAAPFIAWLQEAEEEDESD
jgi:translation initiation factor 5